MNNIVVLHNNENIIIHNQNEANFYSLQNSRIMLDCFELLKSTKNIETYFSRLNLLKTKLNCLIELEVAGYSQLLGLKIPPSMILKKFSLEEIIYTNSFIDRFYNSINDVNIFYQELTKYIKFMDPANISYYNEIYNKYLNMKRVSNFNDLGIQKYKILSGLDCYTCDICGNMDSQIFNMKDYQEGVTAPPFHPGCRCTTIPSFEDEFEFGERAARNMDGKTYYVPRNMSYKEWKEKYVASDPIEKQKFEIIKLKEKNIENDYKEYTKYLEIFKKSNIGRTVYSFQDIKYNNISEYNNIKKYYELYINNKLSNNITYIKWKKLN